MTAAQISRRDFLVAALLSSAFTAAAQAARMVGVVPLGAPGAASPPFGRLLGDGLDARLFTDLSQLGNPQSLVTSNDKFFVRTAAPSNLPPTDAWTIRVGGLVRSPVALTLRDLDARAAAPARVLLECSGNADPLNYGLLSVADWEGILLQAILDRVQPSASSYRVLVSGVDDASRTWRTSIAISRT